MSVAVATLDVKFERVDPVLDRATLRTDARGATQVRSRRTSVVTATGEAQGRAWRAASRIAPQEEYELVRAAWLASRGGVLPIAWEPPEEGAAIDVEFESFESQAIAGLWILQAVFTEIVR